MVRATSHHWAGDLSQVQGVSLESWEFLMDRSQGSRLAAAVYLRSPQITLLVRKHEQLRWIPLAHPTLRAQQPNRAHQVWSPRKSVSVGSFQLTLAESPYSLQWHQAC